MSDIKFWVEERDYGFICVQESTQDESKEPEGKKIV